MEKKIKSGMYGELPIIQIGQYSISMMSNREGEDRIWIQEDEAEGMAIQSRYLEPYIKDFFNKYF